MKSSPCPLCGGTQVQCVEEIQSADISYLYRKKYGIRIDIKDEPTIALWACNTCKVKYYSPGLSPPLNFYSDLAKNAWYYQGTKYEFDVAARFINQDDHVLEVGAGRGLFAKRISCATYLGLETNKTAVAAAHMEEIHVVNSSLEDFVIYSPRKFNVVCAFQVLEHVEDPHAFIESSVKALVPGGKIILAVPSEEGFLAAELNNVLNMPPHHATRWSHDTFRWIAERYRLKVLYLDTEVVADSHLGEYIKTLFVNAALRLIGRSHRSLIPILELWPLRFGMSAIGRIVRPLFNNSRCRGLGHTCVAVLQAGA